jgi:hypothetical protein
MGIAVGVLALAAISLVPLLVLAIAKRVAHRFGPRDQGDQPVQ